MPREQRHSGQAGCNRTCSQLCQKKHNNTEHIWTFSLTEMHVIRLSILQAVLFDRHGGS